MTCKKEEQSLSKKQEKNNNGNRLRRGWSFDLKRRGESFFFAYLIIAQR